MVLGPKSMGWLSIPCQIPTTPYLMNTVSSMPFTPLLMLWPHSIYGISMSRDTKMYAWRISLFHLKPKSILLVMQPPPSYCMQLMSNQYPNHHPFIPSTQPHLTFEDNISSAMSNSTCAMHTQSITTPCIYQEYQWIPHTHRTIVWRVFHIAFTNSQQQNNK